MTVGYTFRLRDPMPKGFQRNEQFPELPVILAYLQQYDGESFQDIKAFQQALGGFSDYLQRQKIPEGRDPLIREGLSIFEDETVGCKNSTPSARCVFGRLELKVNDYQR